ncbi:uncharacterized protein SPPG_09177 [Spizellomyces punctatus DAOM BR117]|uniref:Uncharacterized protein n=1 Tax=Spizellomyces punctatus (strain DAOM BR117) TaxID=645134 RepID=A0A0L0HJ16_SPIPD|nr:uncharacterized protein SPPG_09177 [Spizellomyces punctatus DAOM BR117]KND01077.1 hypothetical protein SPPG_09177 [Spizellomyces punctatus DAOM BR117]|eukprot:XP_016609116.1 hypothetical protein SPPG_09177 [Spizellomyces punctatus DAOM BR117]
MGSIAEHLRIAAYLAGGQQPGSTDNRDAVSAIEARLERAKLPEETTGISPTDLKARFALACLQCLKRVNDALLSTSTDGSDLGARDQKLLDTLLQITIYLGIYPSLEPNVGLPLSRRTRFPLLDIEGGTESGVNPQFLFYVTRELASITCHDRTFLATTIVNRYLADLYAAQLQLAFSPEIPAMSMMFSGDQESLKSVNMRDYSRQMLDELFARVSSLSSLEAFLSLLRAKPPPWFRAQCTRLLSQVVLRPTGVQTVFECFLPSTPVAGVLDTAQLQHVAQLISSVPKQVASVEEYYSIISPQLLDLVEKVESTRPIFRAAIYVTVQMINKHPHFGKQYLLNPLIAPLLQFYRSDVSDRKETRSEQNVDLHGRVILADEESVQCAIDHIRQLLVGNEISHTLMNALIPVIAPLYYIHDFATQSGSNVKVAVHTILLTFFRTAHTDDASSALWRTLMDVPRQATAAIAAGDAGGVMLVANEEGRVTVDVDRLQELLDEINNEELIAEFFLKLLEVRGTQTSDDPDDEFNKIFATELILGIMSRFGEAILKKPRQIIIFAKNALLSGEEEVVSMGLGLLSAVLGNEETALDPETRPVLDEILIILQAHSSHDAVEIREMAKEVRIQLITRTSAFGSFDTEEPKNNSASILQDALKELQDDLIPVRAHGMHQLRSLILAHDPIVEEQISTITSLFLDQIADEDSFIYLNAVKGLSALTDVYPRATLASIAARYHLSTLNLDYRLRIGEALLQTIQRCGEVFGKYSPEILPPILRVMHDPAKELRASALSLLACVAETAPLALLPVLYQVMDYVRNLLVFEKDVEPRRGAIVTLLSLIRGLGENILATLPPDLVKEISKQLRITESTDADELTRVHARTALNDIREIVRGVTG